MIRAHAAVAFIGVVLFLNSGWCAESLDAGDYALRFGKDAQLEVLVGKEGVFKDVVPKIEGGGSPGAVNALGSRARVSHDDVTDALGRGTHYTVTRGGVTWHITAYPGKPFLTAKLVYENKGREMEKITSLIPWSTGACSLGAGTNRAPILDNGTLLNPQTCLHTEKDGRVVSLWNLAACNVSNGRSLIAGFLTNERAYAQLRVHRNDDLDSDSFGLFQAECQYEPPVELAPGEQLSSELLYIAVAETSPLDGLERFATSVADFNDLKPTRRALPHGWDSWVSHYHSTITEKEILTELDALDRKLKRYGWTHFSIDDGWQRTAGDWEPNAQCFPNGMKAIADEIHKRGMTAGLWTEPFTVNLATAVAKEHPNWLAKPGLLGKSMLSDDERILDVTAPGAYDFVKDTYRKITGDWGYDALVETDFLYHLLAAMAYADPKATHAAALQKGMRAIREGAGKDTFIMGVAPFCISGYWADGMRTGVDCGPIWRIMPGKWCWGCVDTLTNAARRFYLGPRVFAPDQDCAFFGHEETRKRWGVKEAPALTRDQQLVWMTGAALTGGAVKIGDAPSLFTLEEVDILRRLLPVMTQPARPIDLFERNEPRIWSLPIDSPAGKWHILGVFNWDEKAEAAIPVSFAQLGLEPDAEYTVFDFWPGKYCGLAANKLDLVVPPASVRLLSLRRFERQPMFLATDSHFSQGATDLESQEWNESAATLSGCLRGVENTDYKVWLLAPKGFVSKETTVSVEGAKTVADGDTLRIEFHCAASGPVQWQAKF